MQVERSIEVKVTLTLNQQEAEWLNAMMQNPLGTDSLELEDETNMKMRHAFFEATRLK